jgi:hypothetical protein
MMTFKRGNLRVIGDLIFDHLMSPGDALNEVMDRPNPLRETRYVAGVRTS